MKQAPKVYEGCLVMPGSELFELMSEKKPDTVKIVLHAKLVHERFLKDCGLPKDTKQGASNWSIGRGYQHGTS